MTAKTPEQRELVDAARAWIEAGGGTWAPETEMVALTLAVDACETSILNFHNVNATAFSLFLDWEPLFEAAGEDRAALAGTVQLMALGTSYLCPADYPQWLEEMRAADLG